MKELIVFDLDGTLIDTKKDLASACNYALAQCGFPQHDLDDYNMLVGRGIYNLFRAAMPVELSDEDREANVKRMADIFVPYYNEHIMDYTRPYPGIVEALRKLHIEMGLRLAVASNKYQAGTEKLVSAIFPEISFSRILGQREGQPIKPDPQIVFECMAAAGVDDISKVLYVGDSDVDMQTARNAKVDALGVAWGFRSREELLDNGAAAVIEMADEIVDYVK